MKKYIDSKDYYTSTVTKLSRLKQMLGSKKPSFEIAAAIASLVEKNGR